MGGGRPGKDSPLMGGRCGAGRLSIAAVPVGRECLTPCSGQKALSAWATAPSQAVPLPYQDVTLLSTLPLW